jgi:hypothetical protein
VLSRPSCLQNKQEPLQVPLLWILQQLVALLLWIQLWPVALPHKAPLLWIQLWPVVLLLWILLWLAVLLLWIQLWLVVLLLWILPWPVVLLQLILLLKSGL